MLASLTEKVFEKYYEKYYPQVYGYVLKKIANEQAAEDLTMDVFCQVWRKFDTFDESKATFQTWLYVIVNNKLKNYYRDRKEIVEFDDAFMGDEDQTDDVLEAIQLQELREHLYIALDELNEVQRQIIICRYFNDMNASEIAYDIGLSPGNVRIQLKRAMDKIRDYFDENNIRWE
ncbi:MAG: sigma-70 family RNA polymerase sigma factor [Ruminococcaceae bacterium]|nr:sigma-70 family RNA polymerase sigma factor [Oscillospiraceae bacterium]